MTFEELLKEKDLHGAQVARKLGVNRSTVSSWARGKTKPKIKDLRSIAETLGVSVEIVVTCFEETG